MVKTIENISNGVLTKNSIIKYLISKKISISEKQKTNDFNLLNAYFTNLLSSTEKIEILNFRKDFIYNFSVLKKKIVFLTYKGQYNPWTIGKRTLFTYRISKKILNLISFLDKPNSYEKITEHLQQTIYSKEKLKNILIKSSFPNDNIKVIDEFTNLKHIFTDIINNLYKNFGIKLIIFLFKPEDVDLKDTILIPSNIDNNLNNFQLIKVGIKWVSSTKQPDEIYPGKIGYSRIYELDGETNTFNEHPSKDIVKKIISFVGETKEEISKIPETKEEIPKIPLDLGNEKYIYFNPMDNPPTKLQVITLDIPNKGKHKYLLGITNNIYTNDTHNNLVGRVSSIDSPENKVKVFWCKNYLDNL